MDTGLASKVALVTGASSGIGAATATALGREGARVALTYRGNETAAQAVAARVRDAGGEAMAVGLALEDPDSISTAIAEVIDHWGGIDALVANAVRWPEARAEQGRAE